jgi:ankyrin repeat protein
MNAGRRALLRWGPAAPIASLGAGLGPLAWAGSYEDFFKAVDLDDARTVAQLLQRGLDPNTVDEKGQVALGLALRDGSLKVGEVLMAHPQTHLDAANATDETPLLFAALRGRLDWVQRLLAKGVPVNRPGWSALHYAASGSETVIVSLLLDRGAAIDARSPTQMTPLMMAAHYGAQDSAVLLARRGAETRLRNDAGLNSGELARLAGRDALAEKLATGQATERR